MGRPLNIGRDTAEAWASQYRAGASYKQIARDARVTIATVHRHMQALGVVSRPTGPSKDLPEGKWREREAIDRLDRFLAANRYYLEAIAHWGDGNCGFIIERIVKALSGQKGAAQ